jgi:dihydroorotase
MLGLQTTFTVINQALPGLSDEQLVKLLSLNARSIFNLPPANINEGAVAELTVFNRTVSTTLTKQAIKSKSVNTPFIDRPLKGKVLGIFHKGQLTLN